VTQRLGACAQLQITIHPVQSRYFLDAQHLNGPFTGRRGDAYRASPDAKRAAVRRQEFGIDDSQPSSGERTRCRVQGVVLKVFVVDRVKLGVAHQP
jgi:hypothetical protein